MFQSIPILRAFLHGLSVLTLVCGAGETARSAETKVAVTISGGHDIDRKDFGRPIVLIAAALEVKPEEFRKAFSGVTPAKEGKPSDDEARRNKEALMKVLKPLGVTDERLNEVSNYYRYRPQNGELWTNTPAKAHAIVEDGKIKKIVVAEPGSGYSSTPKVVVEGIEKLEFKIIVHFEKDLKKNGGIKSIEVAAAKATQSK
jgi:hypothetical protein